MVAGTVLVTCLIASLVGSLVFVFFEFPFPGMVTVMRVVIAPVAHTSLVILIFRIVLVVLFLGRGRGRNPDCPSCYTGKRCHRDNPRALLQFRLHSHKLHSFHLYLYGLTHTAVPHVSVPAVPEVLGGTPAS